jgi:hypothetical protein
VLVSYSVSSYTPQCTFCGVTNGEIQVLLDGAGMHENEFAQPNYCTNTQAATVGALVGPGTHTISISARLISGPPILFGASSPWNNQMIVQVIPQ